MQSYCYHYGKSAKIIVLTELSWFIHTVQTARISVSGEKLSVRHMMKQLSCYGLSEAPPLLYLRIFTAKLNLVLRQFLSNIKECTAFFPTFSGLDTFFIKPTKKPKLF
jgi:hypothetical protein